MLAFKQGISACHCITSSIRPVPLPLVRTRVSNTIGMGMKTLTAIPLSELIKKAGSKRRVAQIAGIQNLGSLSHESVLIGDRMYRPSISTADWAKVSKELVGDL